ncbi:hypothetical protein DL93DRAFT_2080464 [Clavulina sp. PMI_390]|nr:hypothetical protein DL93DRAFT_2080464 [Clavulina sp. PMI_390]
MQKNAPLLDLDKIASELVRCTAQEKPPVHLPFEHPKWATFDQLSRWEDDPPTTTTDQLIVLDHRSDISGPYPQYIMEDSSGREIVVRWQFDDEERASKTRKRTLGSAVIINPRLHWFPDGQLGISMTDDDYDDIFLFDSNSMQMQSLKSMFDLVASLRAARTCDYPPCAKPSPPSQCAGCKKVFYCNKDCQRNAWNNKLVHKRVCATLGALHRLETRLDL